jgi:hypothetical protein
MTKLKTSAALILAGSLFGSNAMTASAADYAEETTNLIHFHLIDFIGWNNADMDVMRTYHRPEVAVDMAGMHTDGIDPHVEALTGMLSSGAAKITQHSPSLAQGEWTAVVGVTANGNMSTIGKWKDGALTAEYLFIRPLKAEEIKAVDVSKPIVTVTTPDDAALRAATGAEIGWSAVMVDGYSIFTQTVDGKVAQQLGFASK